MRVSVENHQEHSIGVPAFELIRLLIAIASFKQCSGSGEKIMPFGHIRNLEEDKIAHLGIYGLHGLEMGFVFDFLLKWPWEEGSGRTVIWRCCPF